MHDEALAILRQITQDEGSEFRAGQLEAISALVEHRRRALVVQRTGWGKSAVYFIATRLLRDRGAGASLLVSPLLALMRNQITMAERAGVRAATINSANTDDWDEIDELVRRDEVDLLLVSPERLNNPRFRLDVLPQLLDRVGMLIVDEAHCISDWGHDFRPDYRRIARVLDQLPAKVPVLCTTATANQRVIDDVVAQLGDDLELIRGTLDRESLALQVHVMPSRADRLAWLAAEIPQLDGAGIVYCLTIRDVEVVAEWLRSSGIDAVAYSGESDIAHRLEVEDALAANRVKAVVATSALGMGYDKPDLGWVIHYQSPGSPIAYYQQVGRAGRALERSVGVLLAGNEDVDIQDWFISTAFPRREDAEEVLALLAEAGGPMSTTKILAEVNLRHTRLEAMLKVLEVEGAVERVPRGGWLRTAQPWTYDEERVARVTEARRAEQAAMFDYIRCTGCLMAFLRGQLDDDLAEPCGRCSSCSPTAAVALDPEVVAGARRFLRSGALVIEPRLQGVPVSERLEPGRALSVQDDGEWGSEVSRGTAEGHLTDELVTASAELLQTSGASRPVEWVTWVPRAGAPELLAGFARRLAERLGVPAVDAVQRARASKPQHTMQNSAQQRANVEGAFVVKDTVPTGAVLLVDDLVDSRWTFTAIGAELRRAGSGPVIPFALARARQ